MIVPMKKLDILVLDKYKEDCLFDLRKLGILHVKYIRRPASQDIDSLIKNIEDTEKALKIIAEYQASSREQKYIDKESIFNYVNQILSLQTERETYLERGLKIKDEIGWYKEWGEFSLNTFKELAKEGVYIRLYKCSRRQLQELRKTKVIEIIKRQDQYYYIAVVSLSDKDDTNLTEVMPAHKELSILKKELKEINEQILNIDNLLKEKATYKKDLSFHLSFLKKSLDFNRVKFSMQEEGVLVYLEGFIPEGEIKKVSDLANKKGWAYIIQDPDNPEEVPTLIRNPGWLRIIEPVFRFMGTLPGYEEYDISFSFLLFFSIFFALLIGDAGYGLIFLMITYLSRKRLSNISPEPFKLMYVLSFATIIWGAISGTWFGFDRIAQLPFFKAIVIDRVNSFVEGNQPFMMYLCFLIAAVHLTIAHSINALKLLNSFRSLAQLGWILIIWSLLPVAGKLVLGRELAGYAGPVFSLGVALVLLFSYPQKKILKGIGIALVDLPLRVVSSFSDIVSYLRLFAVGYATVVMASSFNNIALNFGFSSIWRTFISSLILFLGHGLNIILGLMAVIIHGIRLNMLEFSSHLGMQWSGIEYKPFKE